MKRTFEVTADSGAVKVKITGKITVEPGNLTTRECETLRDNIMDEVMRTLAGAPHVHIPLNRIRVK
jgi:hypothetical protein